MGLVVLIVEDNVVSSVVFPADMALTDILVDQSPGTGEDDQEVGTSL